MPQVAQANNIVNPYGSGNVRLDSTPYVNYFMRQQAHKQAMAESLDKYYSDLDKNVTPTGMRTTDIGDLLEMKKQNQEYYLKNKENIRNPALDNGAALLDYSKRHNDMLGLIQGSKNAMAEVKSLEPILRNPEFNQRLTTDFHGVLDNHNKRLLDPERQTDVDLNEHVQFNPKTLTPLQQQQLYKQYGVAAGPIQKERVVIGQDGLNDIVEYRKSFTPKQLASIGDYARSTHHTSPDVAETFPDPHPQNFEAAEAAYKKAYGPDAEIITPGDAHAAETILHYINESGEQKKELNPNRKAAADEAKYKSHLALKDAYQRAQKDYSAALRVRKGNEWLESQVSDLEKGSNSKIVVTKADGNVDKGTVLGAPSVVLKEFKTQGVTPDAIIKYEDGTFAPLFYQKDPTTGALKKGTTGNVAVDLTVPAPKMSRQQFKATYGKAFASGNTLTGQLDENGEPLDIEETIHTSESTTTPKETKTVILKGKVR